jgi:hypothetical protein
MKRILFLFAALFALLSLGACVEYQESASLRSDGSGQFAIRLALLADTVEGSDLALKERIAGVPGIQIDSLASVNEEGQTTLIARVSFDNLEALNYLGRHLNQNSADQNNSDKNIIGEFAQKDSGSLRVLTRRLPLVVGLTPDYSLQVPGRVVDADSLALDQGFGVGFVRWHPANLSQPLEFRVVYEPDPAPVSRGVVVALAVLVGALLFVVLVLVGRLRRLGWTMKALQEEEQNQAEQDEASR